MTARAFPRYAHEAAVVVRHGDAVARGRTRNVSRGGACIDVDAPLPLGVDVAVELSLVFDDAATSEPLVIAARVAWSTPLDEHHQLGMTFRNLTADQASYLDVFLRFLADREPRRAAGESNHDDLFTRRR